MPWDTSTDYPRTSAPPNNTPIQTEQWVGDLIGGAGFGGTNTLGYGPSTGGALNNILGGGNTPQAKGYGIAPAGQFQDYRTSPGLIYANQDPLEGYRRGLGVAGRPLQRVMAPVGFDQRSPGSAEQFFNNQQGRANSGGFGSAFYGSTATDFAQPGDAEQYWAGKAGRFNGPTLSEQFAPGAMARVEGPSASQGAYARFNQGPADLSGYYDKAIGYAQRDAQRANAAQGRMGSGFAANQNADISAQMRAEQANREAGYDLERARTAGALAQGADSALLGRVGMGANVAGLGDSQANARLGLGADMAGRADAIRLGRLGQGTSLGLSADALDLNRFNAGMGAAAMAQQLQEGRGQRYLGNLANQRDVLMPLAMQTYANQIGSNKDLMDSSMAAELGLAELALGADYRTQERHKEDAKWAEDRANNVFGMLGGMSGMGGMLGGMG